MSISRHKPSFCPACGHPIDAAGTMDPNDTYTPQPGDVSICFGCCFVLVYNSDLSLRAPTPAEYLALPAEQRAELEEIQQKIKQIKGLTGESGPPLQ